jgi:signal transduction histidine kinase
VTVIATARVMPCLLLAMVLLEGAASAQQRVYNVLTIHSGAVDFPANPVLDAGIRDTLLAGREDRIDYFTEYLELDRFPQAETTRALGDYIRRKYRGRQIDLVVAITNRALQFVIESRDRLFPDVPIVTAAIGLSNATLVRQAAARLTGIRVGNAFVETARLALRLHPGTRELVVIAISPDHANEQAVRTELAALNGEVPVRYLAAETMDALLAAVQRVPRGSVILYIWYQKAGAEYLTDPQRPARLVARSATVPVYGVVDSMIGTGVVGGMVRDMRRTGAAAGQMARRILDGTPPESIPFAYAPVQPTFDWQQLQRWRIDVAKLPRGSDIRFRVPTVWETYGRYIIAAALLIQAQLVLIAGLLRQRSSRRRAEMALRAREEVLQTSFRRIRRMAGRLINAQETARSQIARELHDDVCQRLVAISMTVNSLKRSLATRDKRTKHSLSQLEASVLDTVDSVRRLSHDLHPASLRLVGLVAGLKGHCLEVERRHDVEITVQTRGDFADMTPEVSVCLFRIVQESLRNGITHGGARRLAVSVAARDGLVDMTVADDGRGFDLAAVQRSGSGLGLVSIEERAHVVGGRAQIITEPQRGTTIYVRVPVATGACVAPEEMPVAWPKAVPRPFDAVRRAMQTVTREGERTTALVRSTRSVIAAAKNASAEPGPRGVAHSTATVRQP